jgi:hypothetical protein
VQTMDKLGAVEAVVELEVTVASTEVVAVL